MENHFRKCLLSLLKKESLINSFYIQRINKIIDYIEEDLSHNLYLIDLTGVAMFSGYLYNGILKRVSGEKLICSSKINPFLKNVTVGLMKQKADFYCHNVTATRKILKF